MTTVVRENAQGTGGSRLQNAGPNTLVMAREDNQTANKRQVIKAQPFLPCKTQMQK